MKEEDASEMTTLFINSWRSNEAIWSTKNNEDPYKILNKLAPLKPHPKQLKNRTKKYKSRIRGHKIYGLLAFGKESKPIGMFYLSILEHDYYKDTYYPVEPSGLYIDPNYQHKSVAKALINKMMEALRQGRVEQFFKHSYPLPSIKERSEVVFFCIKENKKATTLYESIGAKLLTKEELEKMHGMPEEYVNDDKPTHVVYSYDLSSIYNEKKKNKQKE